MTASLASGALVVLGILITVLGLFAAGELLFAVVGLAAILVGGLLGVAERRVTS